ncbi:MAG: peptide deformylase [Bacteroidia bacterium]|nr:peptide deformylase [Bacteroidia bacterium]MCF8427392.1 peptide deformylase [Bacteroidia bacterium]MCF8446132.1 peptide deformylase [Bacteroidia bacterium]
MILPIVAYGDAVLRKVGVSIDANYKDLPQLIENMWETMYHAHGVGLAAPQVGKAINLFIADTSAFDDENYPEMKKVFINSEILKEWGDKWDYEEGCLSIPNIRENVSRHPNLLLRYQDEQFNWHEEEFDGIAARVIQHEYDHCQGKLFVDYVSELKRRLLKNKLLNISKGGARVDYKMRIPSHR